MSDLFHEKVPVSFINRVFEVIHEASWHTFQILTKRSGRLLELDPELVWPENVWMGVTVENQNCDIRINDLRNTHAITKFLSLEPLLGPIKDLNLENINWVITGGESGPGARPMESKWVRDIRDQCLSANVPFFFKQWGGVRKKKNGRLLEGRTWDQVPNFIR
jgi:protein gp37